MALLSSLPLPLGSPLIDFSLPDPFGKTYSTSDFNDRKVLVIIFMCNHCPYIQAVQERLIALQKDFDSKEVQLIGINSNDYTRYPDDSPEAMKDIISSWGINFPYLIDEDQKVAKEYQAQCTPDIYVFAKSSPNGACPEQSRGELPTTSLSEAGEESGRERRRTNFSLAYHGRIDDNWKDSTAVTKEELKDALQALLRNEKPSPDQKPSMGCSIKWKEEASFKH